MAFAKPVDLHVRSAQVAHLCFETGGILGELHASLGEKVPEFNFPAFHAVLGSMPTLPGHPARLIYDFPKIQADTQKFTLASLRAEKSKTTLNKAVNARANSFYAKYANAPDIISRMNADFSPTIADSKPNRLDILSSLSQQQMDLLDQAYIDDGRTDVVRTTESRLHAHLSSSEGSTTSGYSDDITVSTPTDAKKIVGPSTAISEIDNPGRNLMQESFRMDHDDHQTQGWSRGTDDQMISNKDYAFRVPFLENRAQFQRAQISLIDERFAQFMASQSLPYLAATFQNELQMIDSDVFRTQIAYLDTILMSPISGIVTGVYKNPGDLVQPGETVVRVENNKEILISATIIFRGPINLGSTLSVTTQLFGAPGTPTNITGPIVSVRGQHEDDHWELIARCNNLDSGGKPVFPFGYHFDFDDKTTVEIV